MFVRRDSWSKAVGFVLALLLCGCGPEAEPRGAESDPPPAPRSTRGYILISIDTLRADHLGLYGYPKPTSPFLDSLAQKATVFDEAYSQFPSTLVSHMSMFTGLYPREHGVFPPNSVLSEKIETLPEVFRRNGFRTAGFTEGGYVSGRYGFRRGFDQFVSRDRDRHRMVEATFRRGAEFLTTLKPEDRFFLFLHTYAVHAPYDAPDEYRKPFWPGEPPPGAIQGTGPALHRADFNGEPLPAPVMDYLRAQYDAGIRQTDDVLRRFFAELERLGLDDEVTVILTADHGEEFRDHGLFNHTQLYRETLRVPLMILHPDHRKAVRHGGVVQLIDLAPTFYDLARLQPGRKPTGVSLAGRIGLPAEPQPGTAWAETQGGIRAVYRGEQKNLESLLLFDPPASEWLARRVVFDGRGGPLAFEARAPEPRRLAIQRGEETLAQAALKTDWTPVRTGDIPPGRLRLEADGCTEVGDKREVQCQSFQVRGLRLTRIELYDVAKDPAQLKDLSHERSREMRILLRDLVAFNPPPVAAASAPPLDPELEKSLRALGYLR
jgi:arylsulfatase A-like enzyme